MTTTSPPAACPKCGGTDTQIKEQRFRNGTTHLRETCCNCGGFIRYTPRNTARQPLPITPASPAPAPAAVPVPPMSPSSLPDRAAAAREALAGVAQRANELRTMTPADNIHGLALHAAGAAALASLSAENITSLAEAIRRGQLPRGPRR
jgi:hypothetical protein